MDYAALAGLLEAILPSGQRVVITMRTSPFGNGPMVS